MGAEEKLDEKDPKPGEGEGEENGAANPSEPDDDTKPGEGEGEGSEGDDPKDKHGKPGINAQKYKRDMEAKDAKIAELEKQVEELSATEEGRKKLQKQIDDLKAEQAEERVSHKLEMAGCKSVKAAKALLDDFDGDVDKLKAEHSYLFDDDKHKQSGSTGGKPGGSASKNVDDILDGAMKIKKG